MRAFRLSAWTLLATTAVLACSDHTAPSDTDATTIAVGEKVTLHLAAADTARYLAFQGLGDSVYAATVVPIEGGVYINAFDSASGAPISSWTLVSTLTDAALRTTPDFIVPTTGTYNLRVYRAGFDAPATIELTLHRVHVAPEQVSGAVVIGTPIVGEALEDITDLDRFTFSGTAGSWIEPEILVGGAFDITRTACLTLSGPGGAWLQSTVAFPGDSAVFDPQGGRIQLPSTGTYRVEVASARNRCTGFTNYPYIGGYQFTLHPIDPLPEHGAATIAIGDTITGEAIDRVGDFDRFRVVGAPGSLMMTYPQRTWTGPRGTLRFRVFGYDTYFGEGTDTALTSTPRDLYAIPGSGELFIEVSGWRDGPGGDSGSYRLFLDPIDPAPEVHSAGISIGDTVSDEIIEKLADIDRFTFHGTVGTLVNVAFDRQGGPATGALRLLVLSPPPNDTVVGNVLYRSPGQAPAYTSRFAIEDTGPYTVEVTSAHTHQHENVGPYRFEVYRIDPAPETAPATLTLGDSVLTERLDRPGDIDEFTVFVGQPGDTDLFYTDISFTYDSGGTGGAVSLLMTNTANGETVGQIIAHPGPTIQGFSQLLPAGTYRVRVEGVDGDRSMSVGGYQIRSALIGFAPKIASDILP